MHVSPQLRRICGQDNFVTFVLMGSVYFSTPKKLETLFHDYDCICGLVVTALFDAGRTTRRVNRGLSNAAPMKYGRLHVSSSQDILVLLKHSCAPPCSSATSYIEALVVVFRSLCGSAATIDVIMTSPARPSSRGSACPIVVVSL